MSKPPLKAGQGTTPKPKPAITKQPQTRSTTAAIAAASKQPEQTNAQPSSPSISMANRDTSPYGKIAAMLSSIVSSNKLDPDVKANIQGIIDFTVEADAAAKAGQRVSEPGEQEKVSNIRLAVRADLHKMYNSLVKEINAVQGTCNEILSTTDKVLTGVKETKSDTKSLAGKVGSVSDKTFKLVKEASSYRDTLLANPAQPNRIAADPKVLSDLDRRAKQILVDIFDKDANNILTKSLTSIVEKANEAIGEIEDSLKPADIKATAATKARGQAILITLNSKEAVNWLTDPLMEHEFTERFSPESHIRLRAFNLVVPRVPVTFDPRDQNHLREIEETNGLGKRAVSKAKWIKPLARRRPDQTHAFAILSLTSADSANALIRDGLLICGTKVWPKKQKQEPIQCLKCRGWGHFAADCSAVSDTCGGCGEAHRTNLCKNGSKTHCVTCKSNTHPSWSRDCPEFLRRCQIFDDRNLENALPYFPTEHDWTLTARPG